MSVSVPFFRGTKTFSGRVRCNCFPGTLSHFFMPKFGTRPKKTDILSFAQKYLTHKKDWGPTKNFQGPPAPRGPGQFPPPAPSLRPCLWDTSPMLCQLCYEAKSVRVCGISELSSVKKNHDHRTHWYRRY